MRWLAASAGVVVAIVVATGCQEKAPPAPPPALPVPRTEAPAAPASPAPTTPPVEASPAPSPVAGADLPALLIPVAGIAAAELRDTFNEGRPGHRHEAIDIAAPRGREVLAAGDGTVVKLFTSVPGGLTIYQFDPGRRFAYYYAHLDRYAAGVTEGMALRRGDVIGYVGTSGNAAPDAPHLHFAVFRLGPEKKWWKGEAIDPYPALR
ncbi:MAG: M23 family metallopeptidase [Caldimonas sp.]